MRKLLGELHVKELNSKSVVIEGFANKAIIDRGNDLIPPEAWKLEEFKTNPIIFFNHDRNVPIGKGIDVKVTPEGLKLKARISRSKAAPMPYIRDMIREGVLTTFSVGFDPGDSIEQREDGVNVIKEANLLEVSVVSIPMNQESTFAVSKQYNSWKSKSYDKVVSEVLQNSKGSATIMRKMLSKAEDRTRLLDRVCIETGKSYDEVVGILSGRLPADAEFTDVLCRLLLAEPNAKDSITSEVAEAVESQAVQGDSEESKSKEDDDDMDDEDDEKGESEDDEDKSKEDDMEEDEEKGDSDDDESKEDDMEEDEEKEDDYEEDRKSFRPFLPNEDEHTIGLLDAYLSDFDVDEVVESVITLSEYALTDTKEELAISKAAELEQLTEEDLKELYRILTGKSEDQGAEKQDDTDFGNPHLTIAKSQLALIGSMSEGIKSLVEEVRDLKQVMLDLMSKAENAPMPADEDQAEEDAEDVEMEQGEDDGIESEEEKALLDAIERKSEILKSFNAKLDNLID